MIAIHCGYTEYDIDEMSYIFYKDIIAEIAIKLQYDSVVHLLARDYSDESVFELVNNNNPFYIDLDDKKSKNKSSGKKITIGALQDFGMFKGK